MMVNLSSNIVTVSRRLQVLQTVSKRQGGEIIDTYVEAAVNPHKRFPYSPIVCLLWLADSHAKFFDVAAFQKFRTEFERGDFDIMRFAFAWKDMLDKNNDAWNVLKQVNASPKSLEGAPPFSHCPRCEKLVWPTSERQYDEGKKSYEEMNQAYYRRVKAGYQRNTSPLYCLNCGQPYKYDGDYLTYKGTAQEKSVSEILELQASGQPTFEEADELDEIAQRAKEMKELAHV